MCSSDLFLNGLVSQMSSDETYETVKSDLDAKIAECSAAISRNPRDSSAYRQRGLPRAAAQMKEEAAQLVGLRNEQLAEELLTPLLQACEAANKSHRAIESEVLRAGFGPGSTGSVKALFDKFATAVGSTAKLPFSDAPWRLVRDVAISLNNDSSAPRAAENLIQGILDFADRNPPTAEMIGTLRQDQRIVRKNQVEADLGKSLQAQKWGEAEKLA